MPIHRDRRLVIDLCYIARSIPLYPLERTLRLARVAESRERSHVHVSWAVLFVKAYGILSAREPRLRQVYLRWPQACTYEHPESIAMLAVHRRTEHGERLCWGRFVAPEKQSLVQLQAQLDDYKRGPLERVFRRQVRFAAIPSLLRRAGWWLSLNLSGARRARRVGTFSITTLGSAGAVNHMHPTCLTSSLTYGPLSSTCEMPVTIVFDHRVLDGAPLAKALADLETILNGQVADELDELGARSHAA